MTNYYQNHILRTDMIFPLLKKNGTFNKIVTREVTPLWREDKLEIRFDFDCSLDCRCQAQPFNSQCRCKKKFDFLVLFYTV